MIVARCTRAVTVTYQPGEVRRQAGVVRRLRQGICNDGKRPFEVVRNKKCPHYRILPGQRRPPPPAAARRTLTVHGSGPALLAVRAVPDARNELIRHCGQLRQESYATHTIEQGPAVLT